MEIKTIHDKEFSKYGTVVPNPFVDVLEKESEKIPMPKSGCSYLASVEGFEREDIKEYYSDYFGRVDIQMGYCYGYNRQLNALEWHKSSEVHLALTDFILMLGDRRLFDEDGTFDSKNMEFFLIKKGEGVELYNTTLHFCPAEYNGAFKNVVVLPRGTNTPLDKKTADKKLWKTNKWLVCHPSSETHVKLGVVVGIKGENYTL